MSRFAALQMVSGPDLDENLAVAGRLLDEAAAQGAKLAVLPEYFARFGLPERERVASAELPGSGPTQEFLSEVAARHRMWIVGGSLPLKTEKGAGDERVRGSCLVYDAAGRQAGRYDKQHLFDVEIPERDERYAESDWTEPGDADAVVATPFGNLGLAICYDLRFPELFRREAAQGVDFFALPSAFTAATGAAHWELLVRTRAVENLSTIIAPGQGGRHANGRETWGHSMIVDAWGRIQAERQEPGAGLVIADFDLTSQEQTRRRFPALQHRRDTN